MIEFIILGFLMDKKMSGYEIKQFMTNSTAYFFNASYGSIYPLLKNLEKKNWIQSEEVVEGGKYKKIYTILESGKKEFLQWLSLPIEKSKENGSPLIKIFFYNFLPKEKVISLLTHFICNLRKQKKELEELEPVISPIADQYQLLIHQYGKDFYQFMADWYENYLKELKSKEK